jgi:hypothetical protein
MDSYRHRLEETLGIQSGNRKDEDLTIESKSSSKKSDAKPTAAVSGDLKQGRDSPIV